MIEAILGLFALLGCGLGDGEVPKGVTLEQAPQQIIRAIDSPELMGFDSLEAHRADEWFV